MKRTKKRRRKRAVTNASAQGAVADRIHHATIRDLEEVFLNPPQGEMAREAYFNGLEQLDDPTFNPYEP